MANPQKENGYTMIANELLEALVRIRISGEARQVLDMIFRKTYGFHKKEDTIALSQFCLATGLKKPIVCRALAKLIEMNLIIKKDNGDGIIYRFNKDYTTWKPLSKKITLSKKIMTVIKKDNASLSLLSTTKDNTTKDTLTKDNTIVRIFNFWNRLAKHDQKQKTKTFIKATNLTTKLQSVIETRVKDHTFKVVRQAIWNYRRLLLHPRTKWTYRWGLYDFLVREKDNVARFESWDIVQCNWIDPEPSKNPFLEV